MDDKNQNPTQESKSEDVNPDVPAVSEEATDKEKAAVSEEKIETKDESSDAENPFAAIKEFDVEPKEESGSMNQEASEDINQKQDTGEAAEEIKTQPETDQTKATEPADEEGEQPKEEAGEKSIEEEKDEPETENQEPEKPEPPSNPNARWYVVHTFAGHENKVATALKQRIEAERLENLIFDILVPTQDKIEIRGGKKETVKEKIFPGYILIKMELTDLSWLAVRTTQGVTSFIGAGNKPTPISEAEVASIVKFTTQGAQPTFKDVFMIDDTVKIVDGPFAEFIGKVDSVDKEKGRVRVLVSIFGRETPVELDFLQVQKL